MRPTARLGQRRRRRARTMSPSRPCRFDSPWSRRVASSFRPMACSGSSGRMAPTSRRSSVRSTVPRSRSASRLRRPGGSACACRGSGRPTGHCASVRKRSACRCRSCRRERSAGGWSGRNRPVDCPITWRFAWSPRVPTRAPAGWRPGGSLVPSRRTAPGTVSCRRICWISWSGSRDSFRSIGGTCGWSRARCGTWARSSSSRGALSPGGSSARTGSLSRTASKPGWCPASPAVRTPPWSPASAKGRTCTR